MDFSTSLKELYRFIYKAEMDETWGEHELDAVFEAIYAGPVRPDPNEADDFKWMTIKDLKKDIVKNPDVYTPWFKLILQRIL
jgi:isopentenyl-diphosphate delta-isomerase